MSRNNQPKTRGRDGGGWDRPRDRARTLGERDGNGESLAEGDVDEDNKYGEDGNIPDNDDEYVLRASYSQRRSLRV